MIVYWGENVYLCIMDNNEEKYRQFKVKLEKEMSVIRQRNVLTERAFCCVGAGLLFGIIPYIGWLYLIFSFCYCCYLFTKTKSSIVAFAVLVSIIELFVRYVIATTP